MFSGVAGGDGLLEPVQSLRAIAFLEIHEACDSQNIDIIGFLLQSRGRRRLIGGIAAASR